MSYDDGKEKKPLEAADTDVLSQGLKERSSQKTRQRVIAFKVTHILLSILILWLFFVHAVGLFFFTRGFLLSRLVLEDKSNCDTLPDGSIAQGIENGCWHPRTFQKAVVIIIDALRYDFTIPTNTVGNSPSHFYQNNLPLLYDTSVQHPEKSILLPFIADPPTSTLQRLKALTAGNLPTFIDIGSSFAGKAIEEDNILVQLKDAGRSIVHLGDDTWHSLFPGYFNENLTHAYDSFNVWDLHTVDNGVIEHLIPLLSDNSSADWDVIFAHFLGVDHAGHRYGPDHPAMAEKLQQMNKVLGDIIELIDNETLLVVMGDHGMDTKGDHGGESDDEVQAALWMYSNGPRFGRIDSTHVTPPATAKERPVEQIDLVSTLSLLLGLPIPFNNLGTPIAEAFVQHVPAIASDHYNLGLINILAHDQIKRYQLEYMKSRELEIDAKLSEYDSELSRLRNSVHGKHAAISQLNSVYIHWHRATIDMYRRLWANFSLKDMTYGVALLGSGLIALAVVSCGASFDEANQLPRLLRNIGVGLITGTVLALPGLTFQPTMNHLTGMFGPLSYATAGSLLSLYIFELPSWLPHIGSAFSTSIWSWLAILFTLSQAAGFASNSYTIHEDTILLYFLMTFGVLSLMLSSRQSSGSDRILGTYHSVCFLLLGRAASYSRLCREEQMPGCTSTFYASSNSSTSAPWQLLIPVVVALVLPEVVKAFYRGTASYAGSAGFWIGFSFRIGLLLIAAYWVVDSADNGEWLVHSFSTSTLKTVSITLARCALAIAIPVGIGTFVWAKPCIEINLQSPTVTLKEKDAHAPRPQITILGYANSFGSRYLLLIPILVLATILVLPPMGQFSLAICTWQILCLLEMLDTNGLSINATSRSAIGPTVLAMLGSYHFFKTGHQAVLSSIQWNAAFVPLRSIVYPWSPLLVILNTFGAQILCAAAVPLTVLWKRTISKDGLHSIWSDILNACLTHMLYFATMQLATTMWAGHLRRHLMLYRVFMPRFLMASGVLLTVDLILLTIALTGVRIMGSSVAEVFGY